MFSLPRTRRLTLELESRLEFTRETPATCDSVQMCSEDNSEDRQEWADVLQQVKAGLDSCVDCHVMALRNLKPTEKKGE